MVYRIITTIGWVLEDIVDEHSILDQMSSDTKLLPNPTLIGNYDVIWRYHNRISEIVIISN